MGAAQRDGLSSGVFVLGRSVQRAWAAGHERAWRAGSEQRRSYDGVAERPAALFLLPVITPWWRRLRGASGVAPVAPGQ